MKSSFQPSVPDVSICSGLFFRGILPAFEDYIKADSVAAAWIQNDDFLCAFRNARGDCAHLKVRRGTVEWLDRADARPDIELYLGTDLATTRLIRGGFSLIWPKKGCLHLVQLYRLARLFLRFQRFLKPKPEDLRDPAFRTIHVRLALSVALFSVCEIGLKDERAQAVLSGMPEGCARFHVKGEDWYASIHYAGGQLQAERGLEEDPVDVDVEFSESRVAMEILTQRRDSHEALASGDLTVAGLIPLADGIGMILDRVALYLPQ